MHSTLPHHPKKRAAPWIPSWLGALIFAAIAAFFLFEEHRAHMLGALPYVILLACPLLHFGMHGGHGHHGHGETGPDRDEPARSRDAGDDPGQGRT